MANDNFFYVADQKAIVPEKKEQFISYKIRGVKNP
jgi:hypothetical protein